MSDVWRYWSGGDCKITDGRGIFRYRDHLVKQKGKPDIKGELLEIARIRALGNDVSD